jgi:DNA-binding transcriptional ArsR family regulator
MMKIVELKFAEHMQVSEEMAAWVKEVEEILNDTMALKTLEMLGDLDHMTATEVKLSNQEGWKRFNDRFKADLEALLLPKKGD